MCGLLCFFLAAIFSAPIDEADYPEVELPGDVKNVKNSDNAKQIVNSSSHSSHLNKRRRTDSKKNENKVGSSAKGKLFDS